MTRTRLAALRSFNVRTYLAGSAMSYIGTFTQSFAQWWLVLTISGNRSALPVTIGLQAAPLLLLGGWGGTVVDRFDNRRLLAVTTMLNTVAAIALGVIVATGHASVAAVYLFSLLSGIVLVLERPALQAILSELATPDEIPSAVALNGMVQPLSRLIGPPLASLIIAVGSIQLCCYVNAGSYLLFLLSLAVLRRDEMLPRRQASARKGMVTAGLRYARRDPVVGPVLLAMFFIGLAGFNFPMVMPLMAKYTFHVSEARLSVPMACSAIGSLVGGIVVAGLRKPSLRMLGVGAALFAVALAAYGGAPTYLLWVVAAFPVGFITSVYTTMVIQLLQQSSEPEMLGRVMALYSVAFLGTTPFGAILVAWLASSFDARAPFLAGAGVVLLTGVVTLAYSARDRSSVLSQRGQRQSRRGSGETDDQARGGVAHGLVDRALLGEADGLEGEGGEGGVGAHAAGADDRLPRRVEPVVQRETGEHAEHEAAARVHREGAPRERAGRVVLDPAVERVARRGTDAGCDQERDPRAAAHSSMPLPAYLTTRTSSTVTRPSVMSSSSCGRNAAIASGRSTMTMAMGRSSDSERIRVVWMWLDAP